MPKSSYGYKKTMKEKGKKKKRILEDRFLDEPYAEGKDATK